MHSWEQGALGGLHAPLAAQQVNRSMGEGVGLQDVTANRTSAQKCESKLTVLQDVRVNCSPRCESKLTVVQDVRVN